MCSWSLRPDSPADLAARVSECGVGAVQLALDPIREGRWDEDATTRTLRDAGVTIVSGMLATENEDYSSLETIRRTGGVRVDAHWAGNLAAAEQNAALAQRLGIGLVTFHAGFLPHDGDDPIRPVMLDRIARISDVFEKRGIRIGLETGQESAKTLGGVLDELSENVGVNFDPGNMILYGMGDPSRALDDLLPRVVQLHVKDAAPAERDGEWGTEVVAGLGAVDWAAFFRCTRGAGLVYCVEREAGDSRVQDIRAAVELIGRYTG